MNDKGKIREALSKAKLTRIMFFWGGFLSAIQSYLQAFFKQPQGFVYFKRLRGILKVFEVKNHIERPFINVKMIDLNRKNITPL